MGINDYRKGKYRIVRMGDFIKRDIKTIEAKVSEAIEDDARLIVHPKTLETLVYYAKKGINDAYEDVLAGELSELDLQEIASALRLVNVIQ